MSNNKLKALELELVNDVQEITTVGNFEDLQPRVIRYMKEAGSSLTEPEDTENLQIALAQAQLLGQIFRVTLPALEKGKSQSEQD